MDKKKKEKMKNKLTTTQEVLYGREFRMADRAGGFDGQKR
ncbi:YfhE family protein [Bacillus sp. JJ722]